MKSGKIAEAVLKRSVLKMVRQQQNNVSKAWVGCDAGFFGLQTEGAAAAACTVLAGQERGLAAVALHRACNSLFAAGSYPTAVTVQLVLPETMEESELKQTMQEILSACEATKTVLAQGHTQVSACVTEQVISVTAMGAAPVISTLQEDVYGSDLVMTGYAGLAGTALLAENYRESLHTRYNYSLIDKAVARKSELSVLPEIALLSSLGIRHMHDVAEGGVFGAVWELAERLCAGVTLDLKKIPILQETVELCEYFDLNPYQLKGDGALLFLTQDSTSAIEALKAQGIAASVIGRMTNSNDRILLNGEERRFLEPNRVDDYERVKKRAAVADASLER